MEIDVNGEWTKDKSIQRNPRTKGINGSDREWRSKAWRNSFIQALFDLTRKIEVTFEFREQYDDTK